MAAFTARSNQLNGKNVNGNQFHDVIYQFAPKVCRDITQGNNGAYSAIVGYDRCTGVGAPIGS